MTTQEKFFEAIRRLDGKKVVELLNLSEKNGERSKETYIDINGLSSAGLTALMSVAKEKNGTEIVKILLEHGADANTVCTKGLYKSENALIMAVRRGKNRDTISQLMNVTENLNAETDDHKTVLMYAIDLGDLETIKLLIGKGQKSVTHYQCGGYNSLLYALHSTNKNAVAIIELLLDVIDEGDLMVCDARGKTALHYVAVRVPENTVFVEKFLKKIGMGKVDIPDALGNTPLIDAAVKGNAAVCKLLTKYGADVTYKNKRGKTAWVLAKDVKTKEALEEAILPKSSEPDSAEMTLEQWNKTLFDVVCGSRKYPDLEKLLSHKVKGADVNVKNRHGVTPLLCIVGSDDYSIKEKIKFAKLLVDHGADPEVEFRDGTSAADMVWQKYLTDKSKDMKELVRVLGIKGLDLRDKKKFIGWLSSSGK